MSRLHLIVSIFIINFTFAQTKQFIYEYISVPDSTQKGNTHSEIMVLNIDKDKSDYFSYRKFVIDSTLNSELKDGSYYLKPPGPPQKKSEIPLGDRVSKTSTSDQIEFITKVSESNYLITQSIDLNWKLHPEYITVLSYKAQKATTDFGGRKWIAWFAKDIPFQDGPYKFKGLPGLIVKIEDETKSHWFELNGIKNLNYDFIYPDNSFDNKIKLSNKKFIKTFKENRKYPAIAMKLRYPKAEDAEMIKEIEKYLLEEIKKDNNIIEIDLIK